MNRRLILANVIVGLLLVAVGAAITVVFFATQARQAPEMFDEGIPELPPPGTLETVIVPGSTTNPYRGPVRLVVEGTNNRADAFYRHTDDESEPLEDPIVGQGLLTLNGGPLTDAPPPFDGLHVYEVTVDVGENPAPLAFGAAGGQFRVFVLGNTD